MKSALTLCLVIYAALLAISTQAQTLTRYTVSADGQEVTDRKTNLIWRRCAEGMVVSGGTCTGKAKDFTHEAAMRRAAAQASSTGKAWRLPNIKELSSIVDKSRSNPAIDPMAFPATPVNWFWSASLYFDDSVNAFDVDATPSAWDVDFSTGFADSGYRTNSHDVRLVRFVQ